MALVDFTRNKGDLTALVMGSLGFASRFIEAKTGLTICQVAYRLRKGNVKLKDYRNGDGEEASLALNWLEMRVAKRIRGKLIKVQEKKAG